MLKEALHKVGVSIHAKQINSFVEMAREFNKQQQMIKKELATNIYTSSSESEVSDEDSKNDNNKSGNN